MPAVYSANCCTLGRSRCRFSLISLYRSWVQLRSPQIAAAGSVGATKNSVKVAISVTSTTLSALTRRRATK